MKIIIAGTAYPYRGGLAAFNERLARQLAIEGNDVTIYTFSLQYPGFLFPGKSQFLKADPPEGLSIRRQLNSVNPFNWISVGYKIKKLRPDILIFKYWLPLMAPCFGVISRIAGSNHHTKIICIFDNVIPHEKRPGDRLLTRFFIKSVHGGIAMSESVINDLALFSPDIPSGLNPHPLFDNFGEPMSRDNALKLLKLPVNYRYLLFFGFIRAYKGLDLLIGAMADPDMDTRNIRLIIAGEFYEDDKPYRDLIRRKKLDDKIFIFDRFINDDEVTVFFSAADIVVQPYRNATQSGVTQIAYHFEKPMLVTDVGGLREIVPHGKCGYVVKPQVSEIAGSLADFFINNRKEVFIENIRKEKEKYTWSRMTATVNEVYTKCLENDCKK